MGKATRGDLLDGWLDEHRVADGSPYLIDPEGRYDLQLNEYLRGPMGTAPLNTQRACAYDLKLFLTFLWEGRGCRSWREASADDRAAYQRWRLTDPAGPRVALGTWDREVASANAFFAWAARRHYISANPIVQRPARGHDLHRPSGETPAEASHAGSGGTLEWLPAAMYRRWRDVGIRGLTPHGLSDASFRGRFASRNAAYTDLMIRTGLRLTEQTALGLLELPHLVDGQMNYRTTLPGAVAKGGRERSIYIPRSALAAVWDYVEMERAEAVEAARAAGRYERLRDPLIVEDRRNAWVVIEGRRVPVAKLALHERRRLLVRTDDGLEPGALWLREDGLASKSSGWQQVFKDADARCKHAGVSISCHPHVLRHSFAVITLEQLWRGHIENLAAMNLEQRETYQMVFGDPLIWVQRRLGHRSATTTQVYLHTLQELEMETRMLLVPDGWEPAGVDPRDADVLPAAVTAARS